MSGPEGQYLDHESKHDQELDSQPQKNITNTSQALMAVTGLCSRATTPYRGGTREVIVWEVQEFEKLILQTFEDRLRLRLSSKFSARIRFLKRLSGKFRSR